MALIHVAFGGNLGPVEDNLRHALEEVAKIPGTRLRKVSSLYRTAPVGVVDQPDFLNGAVELETEEEPEEFLGALLAVEQRLGRNRDVRWGPRTVDLDLLLWENRRIRSADLEVPHPRMQERAFVLAPLAELAPEALHPALGKTVGQLLAALGPTPDVQCLGRPDWAVDLEEDRE